MDNKDTTISARISKHDLEKLNAICTAQEIEKSAIFKAVVRKIVNITDPDELAPFLESIGLMKKSVWSL